jgi:hypothetical protein
MFSTSTAFHDLLFPASIHNKQERDRRIKALLKAQNTPKNDLMTSPVNGNWASGRSKINAASLDPAGARIPK